MAEIRYTSRLVPTTADGVLIESTYIKDENLGKLQSEINADLYSKLSSGGGTNKGSVETYQDLPKTAKPGDIYNVKSPVVIGDEEYPAGSDFIFSSSGEWVYNGNPSDIKSYCDGKLKELQENLSKEISGITGRLESLEITGATKEEILNEAKSYTDENLIKTVSWVEDEDLFPRD